MIQEIKDLQYKFHILSETDYEKQTPKYKALMKEYKALNSRLKKEGYKINDLLDMYVEAEQEFEEKDEQGEETKIVIIK